MSTKNDHCIAQPYLFFNGRCEEALEFYRKSMSVKKLIAMFATVTASFAAPTIVPAAQEKPAMQTATPKPTKSGHAAVNGVNYYYAVYGTGEPLLLLHGGLGQIEMFGPNLAKLAQSRQVIGVDLQGHGRTSLGDREISLVDMGNDMAGVLKKLGHDQVDVLDVTHVFSRLIRIRGIGVGSRADLLALLRAIETRRIRPVIDREFSFNEVSAAFRHFKAGAHFGKVVIRAT